MARRAILTTHPDGATGDPDRTRMARRAILTAPGWRDS
jgi:hypothetical protein